MTTKIRLGLGWLGLLAIAFLVLQCEETALSQDTTINGVLFPAGTEIITTTSTNNSNEIAYQIPNSLTINNIEFPAHSKIWFYKTGELKKVALSKPVSVQALPCSTNYVTFYRGGKLQTCTLALPVRIQGIPCAADYLWLYEDDTLKSCVLNTVMYTQISTIEKGTTVCFNEENLMEPCCFNDAGFVIDCPDHEHPSDSTPS